MKHLRIVLLVLLALLLPIRGAVAAGMLCPEGDGTTSTAAAAKHRHHGMNADRQMHADHSALHHDVSGDTHHDESPSGEHPATCHFCASGCCMASMVGSVPPLGQSSLTFSVVFPALTASIPAFHSGGQDRPPRTI